MFFPPALSASLHWHAGKLPRTLGDAIFPPLAKNRGWGEGIWRGEKEGYRGGKEGREGRRGGREGRNGGLEEGKEEERREKMGRGMGVHQMLFFARGGKIAYPSVLGRGQHGTSI